MARKKRPIPESVRRKVAEKYGCVPGGSIDVTCAYCPAKGCVHWFLSGHRPGVGRVALLNLEFDHVVAEALGGKGVVENLVLACRPCNRSKGKKAAMSRGADRNG